MVILNRLPFRDTLDMATMIEYDTKKEIQEHAKLINVSMPSSYRKGGVRAYLRPTQPRHRSCIVHSSKILQDHYGSVLSVRDFPVRRLQLRGLLCRQL